MSITIHHEPLIVGPDGDLDLESGDALEAVVVPLLAPGVQLSIDLSKVSFIDSSGLGALVAIHQTAVDRGAHLTLARPSRLAHQLLTLAGLMDYFDIEESIEG